MEDIPLSCLIAGGFTNYTRLHEKKHVCQTCRLSVNFRMPKRNQYSSTIDSIDHSAEQTTKRGLLLD